MGLNPRSEFQENVIENLVLDHDVDYDDAARAVDRAWEDDPEHDGDVYNIVAAIYANDRYWLDRTPGSVLE